MQNSKLQELKTNVKVSEDENKVVVIGFGIRLPTQSNSPSQFWDALLNGVDGIVDATNGDYPRWSSNHCELGEFKSKHLGLVDINEWRDFDPLFFGLNPSDIHLIDPQHRVALMCTWEAFEDSLVDPISLRGSNTSVFIGCSTADYQNNLYNETDTAHNLFVSNLHSLSNRLLYCFDLRGASMTIDSACSSAGNAISLGFKSIIDGSSDYSVVGGSNLVIAPGLSKSETYLKMLGASGKCKFGDESADGFVRAEGCGVFILKRLSMAIKDVDNIYCILNGTSSNEDGAFNKSNFFAPSKESQCENIKLASLNSVITDPLKIDYVEAHGTGTPVGDPIETNAISMANENRSTSSPLLIGSVKSNVDHLEAASCVASLAKCCLMLKHRQFVKTIHFNNPNPNIDK